MSTGKAAPVAILGGGAWGLSKVIQVAMAADWSEEQQGLGRWHVFENRNDKGGP